MMSPLTARKYRTTLAWIGFLTLYIALPLALALAIYSLNTTADRTDAFYQQTINTTL